MAVVVVLILAVVLLAILIFWRYNAVESLKLMPVFFAILLVGGFRHPVIAAGLDALCTVARFFYFWLVSLPLGCARGFFNMADASGTHKNIEIWKIKKLIKRLEIPRVEARSRISIIMPPWGQISHVAKMLGEEYRTALNINSRNQQSVLEAITSAQQRLKLYNHVPLNGLILYSGTIIEDGEFKQFTKDFEPVKPINASLCICDNKFHTEVLEELLEDDEFGFVITFKNTGSRMIEELIERLGSPRVEAISIIMPPCGQISRVEKMLVEEFQTALNINKRNQAEVLMPIIFAQQKLKHYNKVPPNGLILYSGTIVEDGVCKELSIVYEPFKPISASLFLCDKKFHTEALEELLEPDDEFGFIVIGRIGILFGILKGNTWEVLCSFTAKQRLAFEEISSLATELFINPATSYPHIAGLILAGSYDFKEKLSMPGFFDRRLEAKILNVVEVFYGGEHSVNHAIERSSDILSNVKFIQVNRLIRKYFEEIGEGTEMYVYGVDNTVKALQLCAVETLIVWEDLNINRYMLKDLRTNEIIIRHVNEEQEEDKRNFYDQILHAELMVLEKISLLEWLFAEFKKGYTLEFVTDKSHEGSQFCKGFGGIGGLLHYPLTFDEESDDGEIYEDSD